MYECTHVVILYTHTRNLRYFEFGPIHNNEELSTYVVLSASWYWQL